MAFIGLLGLRAVLPLPPVAMELAILAAMTLVILLIARPVLDLSMKAAGWSIALGVLVFLLWITPDLLLAGHRHLFENAITGVAKSSLSPEARTSVVILTLRCVRAVVIVPVIEELFWRAWLMRWIINPDFRKIPLGAYSALAFWVVAVLFASEHGPYWDVGLAAGILYNWWMLRTRSLGDLILAHAVTNACLSAYVIVAGKWEYWM